MRIWIVNHYALLPGGAGGTRHYSLAVNLASSGHDVTIVASDYNHWTRRHEHCDINSTCKERIEGVRFIWLKTPGYSNNVGRLFSMLAFAAKIRYGTWSKRIDVPDVIVGSSPHLFAAFAACRLSKKFRIPFVLEIRDIWPQSLIDLGSISPRHPLMVLMRKIELSLYKSADRVISLLPGAPEYFVRNGAEKQHIIQIPNGVDMGTVPLPVPASEEQGMLHIIYAGTIGLANGLDTILDAAKCLQRDRRAVSFIIVGNGPQKQDLQHRVESEVIENVTFLEPVPKKEVHQLLSKADACIMLLKDSPVFRWGVSPNKLFDYMAAGRPVLFGVKTPHNIVEHAACGVTFAPEDSEDLCKAITTLLCLSQKEREELGKNGYEYVRVHHDHKQNALLLSKELELLCKNNNHSNLVSSG